MPSPASTCGASGHGIVRPSQKRTKYEDFVVPSSSVGNAEVTEIKRLVLDVLKPHHPTIIEMSRRISVLKGVSGVNLTLEEVDRETESVKITIEGNSIDFESIEETISDCGAVIHSVDSVSAGKQLVEEVETPQDR